MIDYNQLIDNPSLAKAIKFEISGDELMKFCSILNQRQQLQNEAILDINTEIQPTKKYSPKDASRLIGISIRTLSRMSEYNEIDFEINKRTGRRMYKGITLIKYRNNNPT